MTPPTPSPDVKHQDKIAYERLEAENRELREALKEESAGKWAARKRVQELENEVGA